jgi:metal-sulfur cluster biosynthetic enzyme
MTGHISQPNGEASPGRGDPPARDGGRTWAEQDILEVLSTVFDPELHMNIVDLGLVYRAEHRGGTVALDMTLTTPGCPYGPYLLHLVRETLMAMEGIDEVDLNLVWDPPWSPEKMSEEARLEFGFEI